MRKDILNAIIQMEEVKNLVNKSEIARRFGCSFNIVKKYIDINQQKVNTRIYTSKLDNFKGVIMIKWIIMEPMAEEYIIFLKSEDIQDHMEQ